MPRPDPRGTSEYFELEQLLRKLLQDSLKEELELFAGKLQTIIGDEVNKGRRDKWAGGHMKDLKFAVHGMQPEGTTTSTCIEDTIALDVQNEFGHHHHQCCQSLLMMHREETDDTKPSFGHGMPPDTTPKEELHMESTGLSDAESKELHMEPRSPGLRRQDAAAVETGDRPAKLNADTFAGKAGASRCSFTHINQSDDDDVQLLLSLLEMAEEQQEKEDEARAKSGQNLWNKIIQTWEYLTNADRQSIELILDTWIAFIVIMNAVAIGASMDQESSIGWLLVDGCFLIVYMAELAIKLRMGGRFLYFWGPQRTSNMFDCSIVAVDTLQLGFLVFFPDQVSQLEKTPSASLFRVLRLGKLTRIVRVLKHPLLQDLLAMIHGLSGGVMTLLWALVLWCGMVYVVALVFREVFGRETADFENMEFIVPYFQTVPRSMFTTFRCSFGDCTTEGGAPIFEHVYVQYGIFHSFLYFLFVFLVTIGLFNVISAIFVDTVGVHFHNVQVARKKERLSDQMRWCTNIWILIRRLLALQDLDGVTVTGKLSDSITILYGIEVTCEVVDRLASDPEALVALEALDISPQDCEVLSDILDPDNNGSVTIIDMVEGLGHLRGVPRRSDTVTVNLMLRSLQNSHVQFEERLKRDMADVQERLATLKALITNLAKCMPRHCCN